MARTYARVQVSIWNDSDFRALSGRAQRHYLLLLSQHDLSYCGVLALRPRRWATLAADSTIEGIEKATLELEEHHFLVVDRDTEEVLVRTFVKNDGILSSPNMVKAMWGAIAEVLSKPLQDAIRKELPDGLPEGFHKRPGKGSAKGSGKGSSKMAGKGVRGISSSSSSRKTVGERASAPPESFDITEELRTWAAKRAPAIDLELETEKMLNWAVATGVKRVNWERQWQNWMLKAVEYAPNGKSSGYVEDLDRDRDRVFGDS